MTGAIILQVLLIFANAVFAGAEIAVISMKDARLHQLVQENDLRAKRLYLLTEQPAKFLATIQVAITLAGLLSGAFAADYFADPIVLGLRRIGVLLPEDVLHPVSVVFITLILTFFNLVFGELVPKRLAMKKTESIALGVSGVLYGVSKLYTPLVWLLTVSTNLILKLLGIDPEEEDETITEEEIRLMLAEGKKQGNIQEETTQLIRNVFAFDDISVEQVCTHRRDVEMLYLEEDEQEWEQKIQQCRFSHFPVCREDADDVIGVLNVKEYLRLENRSREYLMEHAMSKPCFVSESMRANILFTQMKQSRNYFAVVLDEYGCLSGIATLHDLVEALVGDLEEEEEPQKPADIKRIKDGLWRIRGCAELTAVTEELGVNLVNEDCETFSGFVWSAIDRVPKDGEQFNVESHGLRIEVRRVKDHMIDYAIVRKKPDKQPGAEDC